MMNIVQDIIDIFSSFGIVDCILYAAVVTLIILIVSLIYVLKNEETEIEEKSVVDEEMIEKPLMNEEIDLQNIVNTIDENPKPLVDMTAYEEEQEKRAIISYDELVRDANSKEIAYDDEQLVDNVIPVKKIQTSSLELPKRKEENSVMEFELKPKEPKVEVDSIPTSSKLFSFVKEEAFLKALKELNELLN